MRSSRRSRNWSRRFVEAIEAAEQHLLQPRLRRRRACVGAKGFARIEALRDAVDALYTSDEAKRRFEIMARQVFIRFKALLMEPSAFAYAERHDNIEAIYKKLEERRDTADVTKSAQGTAPDRQRGHPRRRRRATTRPKG